MGETTSNIVVTGSNKSRGALREVSGDFDHITARAKETESALTGAGARGMQSFAGMATQLLGLAGGVMIVKQLGRELLALGQEGEKDAQNFARMTAAVGGLEQGNAVIRTLNASLKGLTTTDDNVLIASRLVELQLVDTAGAAGELAKRAIYLGDNTLSAAERVDNLTKMLSTGATRGLSAYGINAGIAQQRVKELTDANKDLTNGQALTQVFMELSATRMTEYAASGYEALTSTQKLGVVTGELKSKLADLVAKPYTVVVNWITKALTQEEGEKSLLSRVLEADAVANARWKLDTATRRLKTAEDDYASARTMTPTLEEIARTALDVAQKEYYMAAGTQMLQEESWRATTAIDAQADALTRLGDAVAPTGEALRLAAQKMAGWVGPDTGMTMPSNAEAVWQQELAGRLKGNDAAAQDKKKLDQDAATAAGKEYERAMASAVDKVGRRVDDMLSRGAKSIQGLLPGLPGTGDVMEDPNGPLMRMRRLADVAKLGEASPWAAGLGKTQAEALQIVTDYSNQNYTDAVKSFIDPDKLAAVIKAQETAESSKTAFVDAITAKYGLDRASVAKALGESGTGAGMIDGVLTSTAKALTENATNLASQGKQLWNAFEVGILDAAKSSNVMYRVVEACVLQALSGGMEGKRN